MKLFQAIVVLTPAILGTGAEAVNLRRNLAHSITFDNPTHHGKLVGYCLTFAQNCGKPAADRYCEEKGFGEAIDFPKRRTYDESTLTLASHTTCTPAHQVCDTFRYITCGVKTQTYYDPQEHGRPLDGCLEFETNCGGQDAADAFCEDKGHGEAVEFNEVEEEEVETMAIGDHSVCDPMWHECSKFSFITCAVPTRRNGDDS